MKDKQTTMERGGWGNAILIEIATTMKLINGTNGKKKKKKHKNKKNKEVNDLTICELNQ